MSDNEKTAKNTIDAPAAKSAPAAREAELEPYPFCEREDGEALLDSYVAEDFEKNCLLQLDVVDHPAAFAWPEVQEKKKLNEEYTFWQFMEERKDAHVCKAARMTFAPLIKRVMKGEEVYTAMDWQQKPVYIP